MCKEKRICTVCNDEYPYDKEDGSDISCCSSDCENLFMEEQYDYYQQEEVYKRTNCIMCEEKVRLSEVFCSQECANNWSNLFSKTFSDEDIPF